MKSLIITIIGLAAAGTNAMAQCAQASCPQVTLEGTLSSRLLDADTTYLLSGCVEVPANVTITAEAGTVVLGAPNSLLLFKQGAQFISQGTDEAPVVFTSDRISDCRAPGDWEGLFFEGKAPNNNNNYISIEGQACTTIEGGGNLPNDNSGVLKFIRVEFAKTGLTMVSVGAGTEMHDIQVSYSSEDGMKLLGGTVNFKQLAFLNNYGTDILATLGNRSMAQRILTVRLDPAAHIGVSPYSNSIVFKNNDDDLNNYEGYMGSDNTHPIFSNVTILGPDYCGGTADGDIKNGILFTNNTEAGFYNSVIESYPTGFRIEGTETVENANRTTSPGPSIFFEYNSFYDNATAPYSSTTWTSGCATSIIDWLTPSLLDPCKQRGIETGVQAGYSACSSSVFVPDFSLPTTSMDVPEYSAVPELSNNDVFFEEMENRGAFDADDWTLEWTAWNPKATNYCAQLRPNPTGINKVGAVNANLAIAPNPASGITYASFTTEKAGKVTLNVVNSIGQVVRTVSQDVNSGSQKMVVPTDGLSTGVYMINLTLGNGSTVRGKVVVK